VDRARGAEARQQAERRPGKEPTSKGRTSTQTANRCCKLDHSTAQAVENSEVTMTAMAPAKGGDEANFSVWSMTQVFDLLVTTGCSLKFAEQRQCSVASRAYEVEHGKEASHKQDSRFLDQRDVQEADAAREPCSGRLRSSQENGPDGPNEGNLASRMARADSVGPSY
jgi:hypothetical protein